MSGFESAERQDHHEREAGVKKGFGLPASVSATPNRDKNSVRRVPTSANTGRKWGIQDYSSASSDSHCICFSWLLNGPEI